MTKTKCMGRNFIEKEGWEFIAYGPSGMSFRKGLYDLVLEGERIHITNECNNTLYYGPCPAATDFLYLTKLLEI